MQRQTGITNATINAFTGTQFGLAGVVAYANMPCASVAVDHAAMKHPDGRSTVKRTARLRRSSQESRSWRSTTSLCGPDSGSRAAEAGDCSCALRAALPPQLWAAWVLSQSLCG